jgi:hypothetical protein
LLTSFAARLVDNDVGKYMMYFDAGVSSFFSYDGLTIKPFNLFSYFPEPESSLHSSHK